MDRHPRTSPLPSHLRSGGGISDRDSLPSKMRSSSAHLQSPQTSRPASIVSTDSATPSTMASTRTTGYRHSSADSSSSRPTSYTPSYMNAVPARKPAPSRTPTPSGQQGQALGTNGQGQNGHRSASASGMLPVDTPPAPQQQQQQQQQLQPSHRSQSSSHQPVKKGTLLLLTASTLHPRTQTYLETMLRRGSYSNIGILGPAGQLKELKDLKIQIYALLGKLSHSSVGVEVRTWDVGNGEEGDVEKGMGEGVVAALGEIWKLFGDAEAVNGVLCQPAYTGPDSGTLMSMPAASLNSPWETSVAFLHTVASTVIPRMRANAGLFAVTGPVGKSPIEAFYKSAVESLVEVLGEDEGTAGVAMVRAENVLMPEPWEMDQRGQGQQRQGGYGQGHGQRQGDGGYGHGNGQRQQQGRPVNGIQIPAARSGAGPVQGGGQSPDDDFMGGESPTKLYSMWALHEQLGAD